MCLCFGSNSNDILLLLIYEEGAKGDLEFRISNLVKKTLMELIFNPCGEFR